MCLLVQPPFGFQFSLVTSQRLQKGASVWQSLDHSNVSEFYGLAFNFGYMPALILPFYSNGNVVEYVKNKDHEAKLHMVPVYSPDLALPLK